MKRWIILIACILVQTCLGVVYAWSTFVPSLIREHGVSPGPAGFIFGLSIAVFTVSMIFAGRLHAHHGPRPICMTGGILFLLGWLTGSFSGGSTLWMLIGFGLLAGAGIGFGYVCPLATGIQWFPRHKGLITGLAVAGFGLGSVFFANGALHFLEQGVPVLRVMRAIGLIAGSTVILCSLTLSLPGSVVPPPGGTATDHKPDHPMTNRTMRLLFLLIFCGTFGGLTVIGNLKPIGMSIGLSAAQATLAIMLFAVANAAGRICWGAAHDRFGARTVAWCLFLPTAGCVLMGIGAIAPLFYLASILLGFAFGGCFVLFAAQVAERFGSDHLSEFYPYVFLGYGIAGLTGPAFGGALLDISGTPILPLLTVVGVTLGGGFLSRRLST